LSGTYKLLPNSVSLSLPLKQQRVYKSHVLPSDCILDALIHNRTQSSGCSKAFSVQSAASDMAAVGPAGSWRDSTAWSLPPYISNSVDESLALSVSVCPSVQC